MLGGAARSAVGTSRTATWAWPHVARDDDGGGLQQRGGVGLRYPSLARRQGMRKHNAATGRFSEWPIVRAILRALDVDRASVSC